MLSRNTRPLAAPTSSLTFGRPHFADEPSGFPRHPKATALRYALPAIRQNPMTIKLRGGRLPTFGLRPAFAQSRRLPLGKMPDF